MDPLVHQLKCAAAIAILRRKPAEADAYQYTKQLCTKYLQAQTQWRSKYFQAQDALLHLQQQQAIGMTQPEVCADSQCPLTPPSSTPDGGSCGQTVLSVTHQQALTSSYQFIHSLVSLATAVQVTSPEPSESDGSKLESGCNPPTSELLARLDSLLSETVPCCVRHLREVVCEGDSTVSTQCVLRGLDGLILLLSADWMESVSTGCHYRLLLEQLGGLIDDLLQRLFEPGHYHVVQTVQARKLLRQMLLHLTTKMKVPEKYSLLHSLAGHGKTLCASLTRDISHELAVNPGCYEALGIALDCLQQGVASIKLGDIHMDSLKDIQRELESMLHSSLTYRFPLVAETVMRLTSVIELCGKAGDT